MNITITIGRNVGDVPMPWADWSNFTHRLWAVADELVHRSNLDGSEASIVTVGNVQGIWEGVVEDSYTVTVAGATTRAFTPLKGWLADIAEVFGQDAIAVTYGDVEFIAPRLGEPII